jgi:hypothetical protein
LANAKHDTPRNDLTNTEVLTVRFSPSDLENLKTLAAQQDRAVGSQIRNIVRERLAAVSLSRDRRKSR